MKKLSTILTTAVMMCLLPSPSHAGVGVAGRASTLGVGVEATQSLVPMLNVRGGINWFKHSINRTKSGIPYTIDLKLKSFSALIDFHPIPLVAFRLTGGIIFNSNGLEMISDQISEEIEVGGKTYSTGDIGNVTGNVDFKSTAPYFGLGWGNAANSRIGLAIDLGVALQGSPQVVLRSTGSLATDPSFQSSLDQERGELQDELDGYKYYPVVAVGLSFMITP